jgi:hypothetical protein
MADNHSNEQEQPSLASIAAQLQTVSQHILSFDPDWPRLILGALNRMMDQAEEIQARVQPASDAATPATDPQPGAPPSAPMDSDQPLELQAAIELASTEQLRATLAPLAESVTRLADLATQLVQALRAQHNFRGQGLMSVLSGFVLEVDRAVQMLTNLGRPLQLRHYGVLQAAGLRDEITEQLRRNAQMFSTATAHGLSQQLASGGPFWEQRNYTYEMLLGEMGIASMRIEFCSRRRGRPDDARSDGERAARRPGADPSHRRPPCR